jgi:hypothetical protein
MHSTITLHSATTSGSTSSLGSTSFSGSDAALPAEAVDRLYRVADLLARDWQNAGLCDVFGSSMIAAVVRHLDKIGRRKADGTSRSVREQTDFAEALLRRFWAQNARRDAKRNTQARASGRRPEVLALDFMHEGAVATGLYDTLSDDLLSGETGRAVARFLETLGWPRERAWAFIWRESGREWDDVAFLLADRFEQDTTLSCLRKWGERYFEPVKPQVCAFLLGLDRR